MSTVSVDFDGVLHAYSLGWHDGTIYDGPVTGALESLKLLMRNYAVVIHTTRDPVQVIQWLEPLGFPCSLDLGQEFWQDTGRLLVTSRKLPCVAYRDYGRFSVTTTRHQNLLHAALELLETDDEQG